MKHHLIIVAAIFAAISTTTKEEEDIKEISISATEDEVIEVEDSHVDAGSINRGIQKDLDFHRKKKGKKGKPGKGKPGKKPGVPEKVLDRIRDSYAKYLDESFRDLQDTGNVDGFIQKHPCAPTTVMKCIKSSANAILSSNCLQKKSISEILTCIEKRLPKGCTSWACIQQIFVHVENTCSAIPFMCPTVPRKTVNGSQCNRDCTKTKDYFTCEWTFTVKNQYSDQPGRLADGRNRSVLTYNGEIPGPNIVICELDYVKIKLENDIKGTFEERQGQSNGTTLHIHGVRQFGFSYEDGVPGVNQCEVLPNNTFTYNMDNTAIAHYHENSPPGTYWYHSHVGTQRTNGLYGAFIIKPRKKSSLYDIDDAKNMLILQEWYKTDRTNIPISILINGNGRVGATMNKVPDNVYDDMHIYKYLKGESVDFDQETNPNYPDYSTNYTEFEVKYNLRYRFRIIGAISQNFPLCVSVENHKFTARSTDSIDFKPVKDLNAVCLASGERYDIIIKTKKKKWVRKTPYKIKVFGKSSENSPLCTVAWLNYPGQIVDYTYITNSSCHEFELQPSWKILNPIMDLSFKNTSQHVTLNDLVAVKNGTTIQHELRYSHYFELAGLTFNNISMKYNDVPFLFQSPPNTTNRCGPKCDEYFHFKDSPLTLNFTCPNYNTSNGCEDGTKCQCEHVVHQPGVPGFLGKTYWFETVLINPSHENMGAAHPIHQHGGWFRVLAVRQFDINEVKINKTYIMDLDTSCPEGHSCLYRNYDHPIQKDTVQVPINGYVIYRTTLDNIGTWLVHCHINHHILSGMAMVLEIGGLTEIVHEEVQDFPIKCQGTVPQFSQQWSLPSPFSDKKNKPCPRNLNQIYQNPSSIEWYFGMKPVQARVCTDHSISFNWIGGHNVNIVSEEVWGNCGPFTSAQQIAANGNYFWPGSQTNGTFYFACGVEDGYHCEEGGLKAKVTVVSCK